MIVARFVLLSLLLSTYTVCAPAQTVRKCVDTDGHITYTDEPCPPGTAVPAPHIAPPPAYVPPPPESVPAQREAPRDDEFVFEPPPPPLPELYRCTRYDGQESYVSSDPRPRVYQVPVWAVLPDMTSSGAGGISTSRPPAGAGEALAAYTTVADTCRPMPRRELCAYWAERREIVSGKRRIAFNDTRPALEQEEAGLIEQLATHCR